MRCFFVERINPKHEIRISKQCQMTEIQMTGTMLFNAPFRDFNGEALFPSFEHLRFEFISDLSPANGTANPLDLTKLEPTLTFP